MNQLTPEQLDMVKRLQPLFREKMGAVKEGDAYAFQVLPDQWMIEYHNGVDQNWKSHTEHFRSVQGYKTLAIPKPIDWQNPERGLWGDDKLEKV